MTLTASTLQSALLSLPNTAEEATACSGIAEAFKDYFAEAQANGAPVAAAALSAPQEAMATALSGMGGAGQGAVKFAAAISTFWASLVPATAWPGATAVTPPPGLSGLAAALSAVFASNVSGKKSKADSLEAVANAIHGCMATGGIAVFAPPIGPLPIT